MRGREGEAAREREGRKDSERGGYTEIAKERGERERARDKKMRAQHKVLDTPVLISDASPDVTF